MTVNTLKLYSQQNNGSTYADPLDPNMTVRFKTTSTSKNLDGQKTTNYLTEIISNDIFNITIGTKDVQDTLSVRIRVSGSVQSQARLGQMLSDLVAKIPSWIQEDVLVGFQPITPPINTVP